MSRLDTVSIATSLENVLIPWDLRQALLDRMRKLDSCKPIVQAFEAVGATGPVRYDLVPSPSWRPVFDSSTGRPPALVIAQAPAITGLQRSKPGIAGRRIGAGSTTGQPSWTVVGGRI